MTPNEPRLIALALVTVGALMALSALTSRLTGRLGVPLLLVFLAVGMFAGEDGLGIHFADFGLAFQAGTLALVLILFDGGLNTAVRDVRAGLRPAAVLATLGVVITAAVVSLAAWLLGAAPLHAALLGAIVSSTDAAAVFSVLRGSGIQLRKRVGITLELESGLNDPMAVLLTVVTTRLLTSGEPASAWLALEIVGELVIGAALGWLVGWAGRQLLVRARLAAGGLYPVLTLALAMMAYGLPTLLHGSGFLAVYVAAVVVGNARELPYRAGLLRVHDAAAWVAQVGMFLVLGLLVTPHRLLDVAPLGLALGLVLAFVARPAAVALSVAPFRYTIKELAYVAWVGLRGAVPIILATYPVMAGAPGAIDTFHLVFFIVVVNAIVPGSTIRFVTDRLGLRSGEPPPPAAVLEVTSTQQLAGKILAFHVDKASAASGVAIKELPFPPETTVMLIVRAGSMVAPRGDVTLQPGDHLYIVTTAADEPLVRLIFGQQEEM